MVLRWDGVENGVVVRPVRRVERYGWVRIRKVASGSFPREANVRKKQVEWEERGKARRTSH
jgi:hypothetical protein